MLHPVTFLGAFGIIETLNRADQIARYSPYAFKRNTVRLVSSALWAFVVDYPSISACRISIKRMIYSAVPDAAFAHIFYNTLKSIEIILKVAIKFDVGDVSSICQLVIRGFESDFIIRINLEAHRDMKAIGINTDNLTKDFGEGRGVFGVSLGIKEGEVFGLAGINGSGKTTLMRHLMGFLHPDSGSSAIKGMDCWSSAEAIKKVCRVHSRRNLVPRHKERTRLSAATG